MAGVQSVSLAKVASFLKLEQGGVVYYCSNLFGEIVSTLEHKASEEALEKKREPKAVGADEIMHELVKIFKSQLQSMESNSTKGWIDLKVVDHILTETTYSFWDDLQVDVGESSEIAYRCTTVLGALLIAVREEIPRAEENARIMKYNTRMVWVPAAVGFLSGSAPFAILFSLGVLGTALSGPLGLFVGLVIAVVAGVSLAGGLAWQGSRYQQPLVVQDGENSNTITSQTTQSIPEHDRTGGQIPSVLGLPPRDDTGSSGPSSTKDDQFEDPDCGENQPLCSPTR